MTIHTPPVKKTLASNNMIQVEIQTNLKDAIAKQVKLSRLLQTLDSFLKPRNARTSFPFHMDPESVLDLYKQKSILPPANRYSERYKSSAEENQLLRNLRVYNQSPYHTHPQRGYPGSRRQREASVKEHCPGITSELRSVMFSHSSERPTSRRFLQKSSDSVRRTVSDRENH